MKSLSKIDKLKAFSAPKMIDPITLFNKNGKPYIYTGWNINGINHYLEMIGTPTNLTSSGQISHYFGTSSSINNNKASIQIVIIALCVEQKIIY